MIEELKTLTVKRPSRRPSAEQITAFADVPTSFVVDAMGGSSAMDTAIEPMAPDDLPVHIAGPAVTAGNSPGDVRATLAAINFVTPGDVLVSAAAGYQGCAAFGDRAAAMMVNSGGIGFVSDGPVRDRDGIIAAGLQCWCTGLTPNSPYTAGPGTIGLPVLVGGQRVETGDMIIADRDGVVVVPFDDLDRVIARLAEVRVLEEELDAQLSSGAKVSDWVAGMIEGDGVTYV